MVILKHRILNWRFTLSFSSVKMTFFSFYANFFWHRDIFFVLLQHYLFVHGHTGIKTNMVSDKHSEHQLMARMEQLYRQFHTRLYLYALTILENEDDAKDAVSDVMQQIWEQWHDNPEIITPGPAFLYTAVRNRSFDKLRHSRVTGRYAEAMRSTEMFAYDEQVEEYETRVERIRDAIAQLPEPGQTVLRHTYFKHLTYKQTAEILGMSENMVHKHMLRMFRLLREIMAK